MQGGREIRRNSNKSRGIFDVFDDISSHGKMFEIGGRDPFDDPFFTRPFGSFFRNDNMFSSSFPGHSHLQQRNRSKGPIIEELDDDKEEEEKNSDSFANMNPIVEHPDDDHGVAEHGDGDRYNKGEIAQQNSRSSVKFQRVIYGGINGSYYTATTSLRTGHDGVSFEESNQAYRTTGEATHKISRGIHDKGHSVTRKLDSSGKVDTVQTLHNLNEDELAGFEQAWKGSANCFPTWKPSFGSASNSDNTGRGNGGLLTEGGLQGHIFRDNSFVNARESQRGRPKKVVKINIE